MSRRARRERYDQYWKLDNRLENECGKIVWAVWHSCALRRPLIDGRFSFSCFDSVMLVSIDAGGTTVAL